MIKKSTEQEKNIWLLLKVPYAFDLEINILLKTCFFIIHW